MSIVFGCIADDFTGATDIAGILARAGVEVNLRLGVPGVNEVSKPAAFEIIALKCRTAPVADAISECLAALNWLRDNGASRYYWKYCSTFDSTPTGNIGPVAEALLSALGESQTIYCPAFPENGRSIYMGHLFVGEQPLHESPMKDHPLTPMLDADLMRTLQPQVTRPVEKITLPTVRAGIAALQDQLEELNKRGIAHCIVDAVDGADLKIIVQATGHLRLLTGGSALALHLPALFEQQGLLSTSQAATTLPNDTAGQIVLSGSCSAMTRKQVEAYSEHATCIQLDPVALANSPDTLKAHCVALSRIPPDEPKLIYATATPDEVARTQATLGTARAGALVEEALAALALTAFASGVRRFVVAGGETSGAVVQSLGVHQLQVGTEIAPGVPWTYAQCRGETIALALKSGNFGDENFFRTALDASA